MKVYPIFRGISWAVGQPESAVFSMTACVTIGGLTPINSESRTICDKNIYIQGLSTIHSIYGLGWNRGVSSTVTSGEYTHVGPHQLLEQCPAPTPEARVKHAPGTVPGPS